jgi:hypothetical protein
MALNHTTHQVQLGAICKVARKIKNFIDDCKNASDASDDRRLLSVANGFQQSDSDQAKIYGRHTGHFDGPKLGALRGLWTGYRALFESSEDYGGLLRKAIGMTAEEIAGGAISYEYEELASGQVTIIGRRGLWGALYRAMDEDDYKVVANAISFGTFTAGAQNRGATLTVTSMSGLSHALPGVLRLLCVDESVTSPKFSLVNVLDPVLPDGTPEVAADRQLTCEKTYQDGQTGIFATLTRPGLAAPTKAGDGGSIFSGTTTISTPKTADMEGGVMYVRVLRQTDPDWLIEFYSSSARTKRVGSLTIDGTSGTVAIDYPLVNGTRFQHSAFDKAAAAALLTAVGDEDADITFDILTPRKGDTFYRTVANDFAGNYSTILALLRRASLPVAGTNLYTDSNAANVTV